MEAEHHPPSVRVGPHVAALAALWLALTVGQWYGHLALPPEAFGFRDWESVTANDRPFKPRAVWRGISSGDLGHMLGLAAFKNYHPVTFTVDEYGFRNPVGQYDKKPEVVIVGDSFAAGSQLSDREVLSALIEQELGLVTYNYATMPLRGFYYDRRFVEQPPKAVIALHVERELAADLFAIPDEADYFSPTKCASMAEYAAAVRPGPLGRWRIWRRDINRRSLLGRFSRTVLKNGLYHLGLYRTPDQIFHIDQRTGFLYYAESGRQALHLEERLSALPGVLDAAQDAQRKLARLGIKLLIVIAPNKETVHAGRIPALRGVDAFAVLDAFFAGCRERGLECLDTHKLFLESRLLLRHTQGYPEPVLYFPDDTHLNALGHRVLLDGLRDWLAEAVRPTGIN